MLNIHEMPDVIVLTLESSMNTVNCACITVWIKSIDMNYCLFNARCSECSIKEKPYFSSVGNPLPLALARVHMTLGLKHRAVTSLRWLKDGF